jgi:hypothetical protein
VKENTLTFPPRIYYNEGLDAASNDADTYVIYGLNHGETDEEGKAMVDAGKFSTSNHGFTHRRSQALLQQQSSSPSFTSTTPIRSSSGPSGKCSSMQVTAH